VSNLLAITSMAGSQESWPARSFRPRPKLLAVIVPAQHTQRSAAPEREPTEQRVRPLRKCHMAADLILQVPTSEAARGVKRCTRDGARQACPQGGKVDRRRRRSDRGGGGHKHGSCGVG
jgi:hypothetical protein